MIDKKMNRHRFYCVLFLLLSSFIMALHATSFPFSGKPPRTDSSVFIYVADVILDGGMPYLDTFDHKGPLLYLVNALALLISDRFGLWLVELATILISFFSFYKICRLTGCSRKVSCGIVALGILVLTYYFDGGNLVEEYACACLAISLYLFLQFFDTGKIRVWQLILCGASFAAVCMLRINMIVLWGVMCIGVVIECIQKHTGKRIAVFIFWFLIGVGLVFVPIILWLQSRGALFSFFESYFLFNFSYSSTGPTFENKLLSLLHFCTGSPVLIAAPILVFFSFSEKKLFNWLCLFSLALSLLAICISGYQFSHYGMILCPLVIYALARAFSELESKSFFLSNADKQKKISAVLSLLCAVVFFFLQPIAVTANTIRHFAPYPYSSEYYQIAQIVKAHTSEEDQISVCGNHNAVYLLSGRDSVSKYSYQTPIAGIDPIIRDEYLEDIQQLQAKILVIERNLHLSAEVLALVGDHYEKIAALGSMDIYLIISET